MPHTKTIEERFDNEFTEELTAAWTGEFIARVFHEKVTPGKIKAFIASVALEERAKGREEVVRDIIDELQTSRDDKWAEDRVKEYARQQGINLTNPKP
jgi:hypothetical protein